MANSDDAGSGANLRPKAGAENPRGGFRVPEPNDKKLAELAAASDFRKRRFGTFSIYSAFLILSTIKLRKRPDLGNDGLQLVENLRSRSVMPVLLVVQINFNEHNVARGDRNAFFRND